MVFPHHFYNKVLKIYLVIFFLVDIRDGFDDTSGCCSAVDVAVEASSRWEEPPTIILICGFE